MIRRAASVVVAGVVLAWLLVGCAGSTRTDTLKATLVSVKTADAAWHTFDRKHQDELVAEAKDKPSALAAVAGWREKQAVVMKAIHSAYELLADAGLLNDDASFQNALKAAASLFAELKADGVNP